MRLVVFFVLSLALASALGHVPVLGPLFRSSGVFGILLASALLSFVATKYGERVFTARKLRAEIEALGRVDTPRNQGKLGTLLLTRGRARQAALALEKAIEGEPEVAEWHYRLGLARLASGDAAGALAAIEACVAREEEYAYGQAMLRRAECLQRLGRFADALAVLALHERNHGELPEACFRRGRVLAALGRKDEARAAFARVPELAAQATRYQRGEATGWALRARLARLL